MQSTCILSLVSCGLIVTSACGDNFGGAPPTLDTFTCPNATTVFLNRAGGTYTPGLNSAIANTSSIISTEVTLAPTIADADWTEVLSCVADKFAAFNIVLTDQDPGTEPHTEVAIADVPQDIGFNNGVVSVSPFECATGGGPKKLDNTIVFVMWEAAGSNGDRCWTVAQTLASSFGLDHAFSCPDLMTFLVNCGDPADKVFTDQAVECGEFEARACACGGTTQNSFQYLQATLGDACR